MSQKQEKKLDTRFIPGWKLSQITEEYASATAEPARPPPAAKAKVSAGRLGRFGREARTGVNRNSRLGGRAHGNPAPFPALSPSCLAQDHASLGVETAAAGPLFLTPSSPGCCVLLPHHSPLFSRFCGARSRPRSNTAHSESVRQKSLSPPPCGRADKAWARHSPYPASQAAAVHVALEGRRASPARGGEGRQQMRAAPQSTVHCFEETGGGTSSCKELPFGPRK